MKPESPSKVVITPHPPVKGGQQVGQEPEVPQADTNAPAAPEAPAGAPVPPEAPAPEPVEPK